MSRIKTKIMTQEQWDSYPRTKTCEWCGVDFKMHRDSSIELWVARKYCSTKCARAFDKGKPKSASHCASISKGTKGKPKPWVGGELNPNFQNKAQEKFREKFLVATKSRGQPWTAKHRSDHSKRMLGDCNAMRGKSHTEESKAKMSETQIERYRRGVAANCHAARISKVEKMVLAELEAMGLNPKGQFHISGVSFFYDFYVPSLNVILEFYGDYWHFNPSKYKSGSYVNRPFSGPVLVDDVWKRDAERKSQAEQHGFIFKVLWESDYKKHGTEAIRRSLAC